MDEQMERFFRDATGALAAAGWARLWFLEHEGAAVSSFLCFEYAGSVGLYNSGFDPDPRATGSWHRLAGSRHHGRHRAPHPVFDFLRGEEPYKQGFGPTPQDLYQMSVRP